MSATSDRDFVLSIVDDPRTARRNNAGLASLSWFPLFLGPAIRDLVAEGVLKIVEVVKPSKSDPTKPFTYQYLARA